jgi:high-affinity Fe2+/Pb2+ permease
LDTIYHWITVIKNTYLLIGVALVILFALKSLAGYIPYRKFMNKFAKVKKLIKDKK